MARAGLFLALLFAAALCSSCQQPRTGPPAAEDGAAVEGTVRIVFSLPGDDIGSPESRETLERIAAALAARGIGDAAGTAFGMGRMELVVRLRGSSARSAFDAAVRGEYPTARFRVEPAGR